MIHHTEHRLHRCEVQVREIEREGRGLGSHGKSNYRSKYWQEFIDLPRLRYLHVQVQAQLQVQVQVQVQVSASKSTRSYTNTNI